MTQPVKEISVRRASTVQRDLLPQLSVLQELMSQELVQPNAKSVQQATIARLNASNQLSVKRVTAQPGQAHQLCVRMANTDLSR